MKKFTTLATLFTAISILVGATAHAADTYTFEPLGFSKDGKYYAYGTHTTSDGSGYPVAFAAVIEVATGKTVASKFVHLEVDKATESDALKASIKAVALGGFGIIARRHPGMDRLERLPSDDSAYTSTVFTSDTTPVNHRSHELVLEETPASTTSATWCQNETRKVKLTLKTSDRAGAAISSVLVDEQSMPTERACAWNHSIRRVTTFGDSLVVVVGYVSWGFEGLNRQFTVFTANSSQVSH